MNENHFKQEGWACCNIDANISRGCAADLLPRKQSVSFPAEGSGQVLTIPGRGSGTGWLYVYHC